MAENQSENQESPYYHGSSALAPVPMHVASAVIRPEDKNQLKLTAYESMSLQANQQINLLRQQAELIMRQVRDIEKRVEFSRKIYESDLRFQPVIGEVYYLYDTLKGNMLSLVGPNQWGRKKPGDYIATVKLLADRTWDILHQSDEP